MPITIDTKRAEQVFGILLERLRKREFPYQEINLPQDKSNMPQTLERGSLGHALFLFCSCYYMRGGIKSDVAFQRLSRVYDRNPLIFNPEYFSKEKELDARSETVEQELRKAKLAFHISGVKRFWVLNFNKLSRFWEGDPRNFFENTENYEDLCEKLIRRGKKEDFLETSTGFFGFREKMVSMLTYFLASAGFVDPFVFPVPVDFHVLRVLVANGVLDIGPVGTHFSNLVEISTKAREVTLEYCQKHGVSPIELGDTLWVLSRERCVRHAGNSSNTGKYRARQTNIKPQAVTWTAVQLKEYSLSCEQCPIEETCQFNIPAAHYYRRGRIFVKGRRERSPQGVLF